MSEQRGWTERDQEQVRQLADARMTPEQMAARRQRSATIDADELLVRMVLDIMGGVRKEDSPTVTNAGDAATWDQLAVDIAKVREQGYIVEFGIPADEDDWGPDGEWLGEDAWRAKMRRVGGHVAEPDDETPDPDAATRT